MIEYICSKNIIENIVENIAFKKNTQLINFFIIRPIKMLTEMNNTPVGRVGAISPKLIADKIYHGIKESEQSKTNLIYLNLNKKDE